jgi:hypothetical protein
VAPGFLWSGRLIAKRQRIWKWGNSCMRTPSWVFLVIGFYLLPASVWSQSGNPCDLTLDGKVDAADVQAAINMSLGMSTCSANIAGRNACNVVVVQRVINASMGASCTTSLGLHVVTLTWRANSSATGYKIYRGASSGGPYTLLQSVAGLSTYTDTTVVSGQTYYYVVTAVNGSNQESSYSNQAQAAITVP